MVRKIVGLLFMAMLVFSLSATSLAQDEAKQSRVEGRIVRSDKDKSLLTVHVQKTGADTTVTYDSSTQWTSQYHGAKKANSIDAAEVKDGDQVICMGSYDKKGIFHATTISKRLSHATPPK